MKIVSYCDRFSVRPGQTIRYVVSSEAPAYRAELVRLRHSCKGCLPSFPATTSRATASLTKRTARWALWIGAGKRLEMRTGVGL